MTRCIMRRRNEGVMSKSISNMTIAEFLTFTTNVRTLITESPETYNLEPSDAAVFAVVQMDFSTKTQIASNLTTRTKVTIAARQASRDALENSLGFLFKKVESSPAVTDAQKIALGVPIRKPAEPIGVPTTAPITSVSKVVGKTIFAKFGGEGVEGGGKPAGCESVLVFSYQGNEPLPEAITDWTYQGSTTSTKAEITMGASAPAGSKVYLTACWQNPRRACGPLSSPIFTFLGGGPVIQAA